MGFPDKGPDAPASAVFVGAEARLSAGGYVCPRLVPSFASSCVCPWHGYLLFTIWRSCLLCTCTFSSKLEQLASNALSRDWTASFSNIRLNRMLKTLRCRGCLFKCAQGNFLRSHLHGCS
eukprot:scaffold152466_cov19-Tisochrysis_lutea.AAC.1